MNALVDLIFMFFICAFAGWCVEVFLKYRQFHRFINRGFLTGPWLPIYGFGAVLIKLTVGAVSPLESSYSTTFVIAFIVCGLAEYMTSWVLEKIFHARWWDYSQKPMNLNGRIWIGNLVLFGLAGVVIVKFVDPLLTQFLSRFSLRGKSIVAGVLLAVFLADFVVSMFVMKLVKAGIEQSTADNTEEVNAEIKHLLSDKNYFYRRFADAYPNVIYRTERINQRMEALRRENERRLQEIRQKGSSITHELAQRRDELVASLEPVSAIKSDIIEKQRALIAEIYDEATATEDQRALMRQIRERTEKLGGRG